MHRHEAPRPWTGAVRQTKIVSESAPTQVWSGRAVLVPPAQTTAGFPLTVLPLRSLMSGKANNNFGR
jgi:hypothetical protein